MYLRATVQKEATVLVLRAKQAAANFLYFYAQIWPLLFIHTLKSAMPVTKCVRNLMQIWIFKLPTRPWASEILSRLRFYTVDYFFLLRYKDGGALTLQKSITVHVDPKRCQEIGVELYELMFHPLTLVNLCFVWSWNESSYNPTRTCCLSLDKNRFPLSKYATLIQSAIFRSFRPLDLLKRQF